MKKFILLICIFVLLSSSSLYTSIIILPSIGIGMVHGGLGVKILFTDDAQEDYGLIVGAGANGGKFAYSIGLQYSISTFYFSANYGNVGTHTVSHGGIVTKKEVINGYLFELGNVFYFNESKFFLDAGIGYYISEKFKFGDDEDFSFNGLGFDVGIGYKF